MAHHAFALVSGLLGKWIDFRIFNPSYRPLRHPDDFLTYDRAGGVHRPFNGFEYVLVWVRHSVGHAFHTVFIGRKWTMSFHYFVECVGAGGDVKYGGEGGNVG